MRPALEAAAAHQSGWNGAEAMRYAINRRFPEAAAGPPTIRGRRPAMLPPTRMEPAHV
ncbi:hypothetical protein [Azospirillum largimobile]